MNCPNCQQDVEVQEKNFGALYTCSKCQAVYFINFEGQPEYSDVTDIPVDLQEPSAFPPLNNSAVEENNFNNPLHSDSLASEPLTSESSEAQDFQSLYNQAGFAAENVTDSAGVMDPMMSNFENPLSTLTSENPFANPENSFASVAQDISDFGNSEVQISTLNYDLEIQGLDSKEEVSLFKEAISDSRFGWEASDIMKQIKNGSLRLPRLNPVQAFVLMKRIQFLNLELKWKQNVLE